MTIDLIVQANVPGISWEVFENTAPKYSVSLDGYVKDGPAYNDEKVLANFNHHDHCDRLATRSTCAQVLMAIRQGMFSKFKDQQGQQLNVFVNDCDEDVCTSWFLLNNNHLVVNAMNPLINRLVSMEDALDATAGAYPFPGELPMLKKMAWVYEPYRNFRLNGLLEKRNDDQFKSVIEDVERRIMAHITDTGKSIPFLDMRYDIIDKFVMVKEVGSHARTGMFGDGIKAYVSVKERSDGKYTYTIGKLSPFIPLDLLKLTAIFNKEDPSSTLDDSWGGGNNIMGSPRISGSSINPTDLFNLMKGSL
jgi:hypothetical protein